MLIRTGLWVSLFLLTVNFNWNKKWGIRVVDKRKILDAWIMAEMLASGDVKNSNLSKFEAEEYQKTG